MANTESQVDGAQATTLDRSGALGATATRASIASTASFFDSNGNDWSIQGGQVVANGRTDLTTSRVIQLAYVGGVVWQENADSRWWSTTGPQSAWSPPGGTAASPIAGPVAPPLRDAAGNTWSIIGGQVAVNGKADPATRRVITLAIVNGVIWQENADKLWWSTTAPQSAWSPLSGAASPFSSPALLLPAGVADAPGVAVSVPGLKATDTNQGGVVTLTVSVDQGAVSVSPAGASLTATPNGVSIRGTLAQANAALASLAYTGGAAGTAHLTLGVQDSDGLATSAVLPIQVSVPAATGPQITAPAGIAGTLNFAAPVKGVSVADQNASGTFHLTLTVDQGKLTISHAGGVVTGSPGEPISLSGTLAQVDADLATLSYVGTAAGAARLAYAVTDAVGASAAARTTITVQAGSPGAEAFAPAARGGALLPPGFLSTSGSQIVDAGGTAMRVASIGWYGTDGPAGSALQGLWTASYATILQSIKDDGFNTVRIPWSNADLHTPFAGTNELGGVDWSKNADLRGLTTLQVFQKIVDAAGRIGLKVVFDHHTDDGSGGQQPNGLWIDKGPGTDGTDGAGVAGTVDAARFQADWVEVARTFAGNATVIGFDLDNEPHGASWGGGGPLDIRKMFTDVGNAIEAVDPGALIIGEPSQDYFGATPEGDVTMASIAGNPVVLNVPNKMVYSVHEYPTEISGLKIDSGAALVQQMNHAWGDVVKNGVAPVWIGEMGSNMTSADSQAWAKTLLDYMNGKDGALSGPTFAAGQQPVGGSWWNIGSEGGQGVPDGVQTAWGLGHYKPEQQAVTDQMLFRPG